MALRKVSRLGNYYGLGLAPGVLVGILALAAAIIALVSSWAALSSISIEAL